MGVVVEEILQPLFTGEQLDPVIVVLIERVAGGGVFQVGHRWSNLGCLTGIIDFRAEATEDWVTFAFQPSARVDEVTVFRCERLPGGGV